MKLQSETRLHAENLYHLKNVRVELLDRTAPLKHLFIGIDALEAMRTKSAVVPASKHALETICGASCETGAQ